MTDEEMRTAYLEGKMVEVDNHDYEFRGFITIIYRKFKLTDVDHSAGKATGPWRCIIQNSKGLNLIQSAKHLRFYP